MKLNQVNDWLTLLANVGVLAGIIFLAIELQQNTNMMRAQTRDSVTDKQMNWYLTVGTSPDAVRVMSDVVGEARLDQNSSDERVVTYLLIANFRMWENEWYQYKNGLFEPGEFEPRTANWANLLRNPIRRAAWAQARNTFAEDFREFVDSLIVESE